jgi:phosphate/sulfate permease
MSRPSETTTAIVGSIVGACLILLGSIWKVEVSSEVSGAIVTLVAWISVAVTWYIARMQREGELRAAKDGTVHDVPS